MVGLTFTGDIFKVNIGKIFAVNVYERGARTKSNAKRLIIKFPNNSSRMRINQGRIDKIGRDLRKKHLWRFINKLRVFGGENLKFLEGKRMLYLPNHLSHFDYILIPYLINQNALPHPAIIAGKNLDHWPANELISKDTGAIFVDRENIMKRYLGERERKKLKKDIEEIVSDDRSIMIFLDGGRVYDSSKIMMAPKHGYIKEYLHELSEQSKDLVKDYAIDIAVSYRPQTIEGPFSGAVRFFKKKFFPLYFGLDLFAFATQPFRPKPDAYVNFGRPYPLESFIKNQDYRGLVKFATEDVRNLYKEITD
jgi:1-acyl-sn-glycerol-3-phosphate acyltransferase